MQNTSLTSKFQTVVIAVFFAFSMSGCSKYFTGVDNSSIKKDAAKTIGDGNINGYGAGGNPSGVGDHLGELQFLQVTVEYVNPYFMRDDTYPGYYIGMPMEYRIHIKNTGNRTFEHLDVTASHEYHDTDTIDRWWYPYPEIYTYYQGQALPGASSQDWSDISIAPGQEVVLDATYTPPLETGSGLDQTHVSIKHTNDGPGHSALIYDNPLAGVFCPPPVNH